MVLPFIKFCVLQIFTDVHIQKFFLPKNTTAIHCKNFENNVIFSFSERISIEGIFL